MVLEWEKKDSHLTVRNEEGVPIMSFKRVTDGGIWKMHDYRNCCVLYVLAVTDELISRWALKYVGKYHD